MRITNARNGWVIEGMFITFFPAHLPVDSREMKAYYDLSSGDLRYEELRSPARVDRYVLMKPMGTMVIVPVNTNTVIETTE